LNFQHRYMDDYNEEGCNSNWSNSLFGLIIIASIIILILYIIYTLF